MDLTNALMLLSKYHPIVIEGMGMSDPRAPGAVAEQICRQLKPHLANASVDNNKPYIIVIQGDPKIERGISAITPLVAKALGDIPRGLVCLDPAIHPNHQKDADRENVVVEFKYSEMAQVLEEHQEGSMERLQDAVDSLLRSKNEKRRELGKPPLQDDYRDFALLQEVTKASCRLLCGGISVVHTADEISEFSVTSFYTAGLDMGWVKPTEMVPYTAKESSDNLM